jgi:NADH-quinone oxidoreductase subunit A
MHLSGGGVESMLSQYGYIGIIIIVAIGFTVLLPVIPLILSHLGIVPRKGNPEKMSSYECGMKTVGKTWIQFNFRYYFFALIFVAIDVLTIFLYPWAVNLKELGTLGLVAVGLFFFIIMVGYVYAWFKGVLEWK